MTYAFDPELAPVVPLLKLGDFSDVPAARAMLESMLADINANVDTSGLTIEDRTIDGPDDTDLSIRILRPSSASGPLPAVLHIHGGGFAVGSVNTELGGCVQLASKVPAVVVSVEYRLAPEYPFPAGIEDCYTALCWLHSQVADLGVDPTRVAVFGGSAGGGLAAGLALMARDRGGPSLCFQFLGIPELDDRLETPSMQQFVETPMWNRPNAIQSWKHYLGDASGRSRPMPRRRGPRTWPDCRRRSCRPWSSTRCATRASRTPCGCCKPVWRWSYTSTREPSTVRPWSPRRRCRIARRQRPSRSCGGH